MIPGRIETCIKYNIGTILIDGLIISLYSQYKVLSDVSKLLSWVGATFCSQLISYIVFKIAVITVKQYYCKLDLIHQWVKRVNVWREDFCMCEQGDRKFSVYVHTHIHM